MNARRITPRQAARLTLDTEPYLSCEACFELMDVYVESVLGHATGAPMHAMEVHLAGCPACAEEVAALLELAAED